MRFIRKARRPDPRWRGQEGQTIIIVVLVVGIFLLGFVGLAVDFSNLWYHRQMAQGAADAACQAAAIDLLDNANDAPINSGFAAEMATGTPFSCQGRSTTTPPAAPCWYATRNGYDSAGGWPLPASTESNNVQISFPSSISGVTAPPSSLTGPYPYIRVDVTDRVKVFFSALLSGSRTQDVLATAKCGLVFSTSPIPIVVLHPTMRNAFNISGTPAVRIYGGPTQSVQVNSSWTGSGDAANIGGTANLDLSQGGPNHTGSNMGVFGKPATKPTCASPTDTNCWFPGTTGQWLHTNSISDPFQQYPTPGIPTNSGLMGTLQTGITCCDASGTPITDATHDANCPVSPLDTGHSCTRAFPGLYTDSSLRFTGGANVLFVPGLYYLSGTGSNKGLYLSSNTIARPSALANPADSSADGIMFYFTQDATLTVTAQSGLGWTDSSYPPAPFNTLSPVPVLCPGQETPDPPVPATLLGNIFLGPCTGSWAGGSSDHPARGVVFFQDRAVAGTGNLSGGGGLLLAGSIYFHQESGSPGPPYYNSIFNLSGNSGSDTRVLGNIIVDQLDLGGGGTINMVLNPYSFYKILKVQLLQ